MEIEILLRTVTAPFILVMEIKMFMLMIIQLLNNGYDDDDNINYGDNGIKTLKMTSLIKCQL